MWHNLRLAGITFYGIGWFTYNLGLPQSRCIMYHMIGGNFHRFQSPLTIPLHRHNGKPLGLWRETVNGSKKLSKIVFNSTVIEQDRVQFNRLITRIDYIKIFAIVTFSDTLGVFDFWTLYTKVLLSLERNIDTIHVPKMTTRLQITLLKFNIIVYQLIFCWSVFAAKVQSIISQIISGNIIWVTDVQVHSRIVKC